MSNKKIFFDKQPITNNAILELISGGFLDDALILIDKKLESDNNDLLLIYKGVVLNTLKRYDEALPIFMKLCEKERNNLNLKNLLITLSGLKQINEAHSIANEIIKNNSNETKEISDILSSYKI